LTTAIALRQGNSTLLKSRQFTGGTTLEFLPPGGTEPAVQVGCDGLGDGEIILRNIGGGGGSSLALMSVNVGIAEEPAIGLFNSTQTFLVDLAASGDASVFLPESGVSSFELQSEPGVAAAVNTNFVTLTSTSPASVISRTITPPASGYILALGQTVCRISHAQGTQTSGAVGLSDDGVNLGTAQDVNVILSNNAASGSYGIPLHVNGVFPASAGVAKTIHILASEASGDIDLEDLSLTLVYLPTSYGTVSPTLMVPGGGGGEDGSVRTAPQTEAEIADERAESERANRARIGAELEEMQVQIDRIRRELSLEASARR